MKQEARALALSDKVKALLTLTGKKPQELAEHFQVTTQSLRNKMSRNSYTAADLIEIVDFVGARLVIEVDDGTRMTLSKSDL